MRRKYTFKDTGQTLVENIPMDYIIKEHIEEDFIECNHTLIDNHISGLFKQIRINGIRIDYVDLKHKEPVEMEIVQDEAHLEICFELAGHKRYTSRNGDCLETLNGRYSFFYFENLSGVLSFFPEKGRRRCFEIELSIPFLERLLNNDLTILGKFGEKLHRNENTVLINNSTISLQMRRILKEILFPPQQLSGILRNISINSQIYNLIGCVIQQVKEVSLYGVANSTLSMEDIGKIHRAREIIINKIDNPYSLIELSRAVGINDFKLKKGFKEIFGTTVFKYLFDERMERAKTLLLADNLIVSEISSIVGYKNPSHFTNAFKRKFGYSPSELKKEFNQDSMKKIFPDSELKKTGNESSL